MKPIVIKTDQSCMKCAKGTYVRTKVTSTSWEFRCNHCGHTEYRYEQPAILPSKNGKKD